MGLRKWRHVNYLPAAHSLRLMGKVHCCISGATTETEVFREPCFCSDRAVFDTIGAIIHTALLQLVTTIRSVLVETACPPKYRRNLHTWNYVPIWCGVDSTSSDNNCWQLRIIVRMGWSGRWNAKDPQECLSHRVSRYQICWGSGRSLGRNSWWERIDDTWRRELDWQCSAPAFLYCISPALAWRTWFFAIYLGPYRLLSVRGGKK